jgi:hypothetical protein
VHSAYEMNTVYRTVGMQVYANIQCSGKLHYKEEV